MIQQVSVEWFMKEIKVIAQNTLKIVKKQCDQIWTMDKQKKFAPGTWADHHNLFCQNVTVYLKTKISIVIYNS